MNMNSVVDRKTYILNRIEAKNTASVAKLASELKVSEMTIRRDLSELENKGLIRRVYGGAVSARGRSYEPPLIMRETNSIEEKRSIGKIAAQLIEEGDSIALDVGSTTIEVAKNLISSHNLTIMTPSLHIANLLSNQPDIRLILSGGIIRHSENSCIGDLAQRAFKGLFIDKLFLAVAGMDAKAGLTEYNWDDTMVKQAMIQSAKEVIVVSDSSKFDKIAFAHIAPLKITHRLVTDQLPTGSLLEKLQESNVEIIIAD